MAYENNFIYIVKYNVFKVVKVSGTSMTEIYSENISGAYARSVVVYNGFIGLIVQSYSPVRTTVYVYYNNGVSVGGVRKLSREGYYLASRELNGKLSLIVQNYAITDFSWDVSGVGAVFSDIGLCSTWTAGNYVRNFATINLGFTVSDEFMAYIGCDYAYTAYFSTTGNWHVVSYGWSSGFINSIIQRTDFSSLVSTPSQWLALSNTYIPYQTALDESSCNLRVAARTYIGSVWRLRLYSFDCLYNLSFSGLYGPDRQVIATRWVGASA